MGLIETLLGTANKQTDNLTFQLFLHSPIPTVVTDEQSIIVMVNSAFSNLTGYNTDEAVGEKMSLLKSGQHDHAFYEEFWEKLTKSGAYEGEIWSKFKDQSQRLLSEKIKRIHHQSKNYYVGMIEDITKSRKLDNRYQHLATHDALTGLPNKTLAKDRFTHATRNSFSAGERVGILLCDLNEFTQVTDLHGKHVGDMVLQETAKQLTDLVREGDTVSWFGGDEFLIIFERLRNSDELAKLVKNLQEQLHISIEVEEQTIEVSMSLGSACFPSESMTFENLLQVADAKIHEQKKHYYGYNE